MLKYRLLTAALLIPLVVGGIVWASTAVLAWILAGIVMLGAWEWTRLMGLVRPWARGLYLLLIGALLPGAAWLLQQAPLLLAVLITVMLLWCLAVGWIIHLNRAGPLQQRMLPLPLSGLLGVWLLLPMWMSLVLLHGSGATGPLWVLLMMALIWGADSGAYFAGRRWGKHKLAAQVSPGKTWEGVAGGIVVALLVVLPLTAGLVPGAVLNLVPLWLSYTLICIVTIAFSVSGDLLESVAKRRAGVKDSGRILPGHGGVLDRIDSLTAAAPCFTLGLIVAGLIPGAGR